MDPNTSDPHEWNRFVWIHEKRGVKNTAIELNYAKVSDMPAHKRPEGVSAGRRVTTRLSPDMSEHLSQLAAAEGLAEGEIIRRALAELLDKELTTTA